MGRALAIVAITSLAVAVALGLFGSGAETTVTHDVALADGGPVTVLPFPDNPDPELCGKPEPWLASDDRAWLSGYWENELIEPDVLLYDSHARTSVTGSAPTGSEVRIVLTQTNPVLDFYFVEVADQAGVAGWVPAPFLSFDPVGD